MMSNHIIINLKEKLDAISAHGELDVETQRNALKEELQFYVLNFIYHHPNYSDWTMYGGSALRICHELDRMSVDLDFEVAHSVSNLFLDKLKEEVGAYFKSTYGFGEDFLSIAKTNKRGLTLRFHVGNDLGVKHPSNQVYVKIDLNHFVALKTVIERWPINRGQLSFVIKTYNMSALMASKIVAIFLRRTRGVGKELYEEKGRDIYDLLWYMNKKVVPDLDYLKAKDVEEARDLRTLFDKLTIKMNGVNDKNLKQDLTPLFMNQTFIKNWLENWRESYLRLLDGYKIRVVTTLSGVDVVQDIRTDAFSFAYQYNTEDVRLVRIIYSISDYWIYYHEGDLSISIDEKIKKLVEYSSNGVSGRPALQDKLLDKLLQYATLFYQKTEKYIQKTNRMMLGDVIITKLIRTTANNLNQKEQVFLNRSALLSCDLDDLLK